MRPRVSVRERVRPSQSPVESGAHEPAVQAPGRAATKGGHAPAAEALAVSAS